MNEVYYIISAVPFLKQYKRKTTATSPISIGSVGRTADGAFLENLVIIGDPLPCVVTKELLLVRIIINDEEVEMPQVRLRLFSSLSREEKVELDSDLNGDPALEIREIAEVVFETPEDRPDEMTVRYTFRIDEKGISVSAWRKDTGEDLQAEILLK